ncbi:MAG: 4-hydroxy-tetrahydrodipicolinate reductase [Clostridiales Family XIII bacterium]|jgi:4-hydroxy-tetrahydrodipicolinate reductase|nr:4-hydroxy-tetrahydrodipicolinate reductase [Clostridiales Family XIII bacterium]
MKVIISGINGKMGRVVLDTLSEQSDITVVAGFDRAIAADGDPVYRGEKVRVYGDMAAYDGKADVIIDFSHFSAVSDLMRYATASNTPVVVATTALGEAERAALRDASKSVAVFHSANMSLGINLAAKMSRLAMPSLEADFNVEIIEKHHTAKADSPSGTALLLADAINEACAAKKNYLYGRHSNHDECKMTDLGIHAVRGGSLPGQHTVLFAGPDETIEITHTVYSRKVFALGALKAARFIVGQEAGMYSMDDLI